MHACRRDVQPKGLCQLRDLRHVSGRFNDQGHRQTKGWQGDWVELRQGLGQGLQGAQGAAGLGQAGLCALWILFPLFGGLGGVVGQDLEELSRGLVQGYRLLIYQDHIRVGSVWARWVVALQLAQDLLDLAQVSAAKGLVQSQVQLSCQVPVCRRWCRTWVRHAVAAVQAGHAVGGVGPAAAWTGTRVAQAESPYCSSLPQFSRSLKPRARPRVRVIRRPRRPRSRWPGPPCREECRSVSWPAR